MPEDRADTTVSGSATVVPVGEDRPRAKVPPRSPAAYASGEAEEGRHIGLLYLSLLAFAVGIVAGFGALAFRELIGLVHNLLFLGRFVVPYDANIFTPLSPWGPFVILVPV